jgi:iron complex transport system substrate-binding protein
MRKLSIFIISTLAVVGFLIYTHLQNNSVKQVQTGGIISLMPSNTEILFELGAQNITGVSNFCNWPPETKNIKKIGDSFAADTEALTVMKPKTVYISEDALELKMKLDALNISNTVVANAKNIQDIYGNIRLIAAAEGLNAQPLISELEKYAGQKPELKIKAFVEIDSDLWTIGGESFINDLIEYAGAENIFKDIKTSYFQTTTEAVLKRKPDIIISVKMRSNQNDFLPVPLQNKKIIRLEPDIYARPTPRAIRNIPLLKERI